MSFWATLWRSLLYCTGEWAIVISDYLPSILLSEAQKAQGTLPVYCLEMTDTSDIPKTYF